MKIKTQLLNSALNCIKPIITRRNTLPILSTVRLHTKKGQLHIAASNLDEFIVEQVDCDGELKPICVSFNHFSMSLYGDETSIEIVKGAIVIKCGLDETQISTLDAEEFQPQPKMDKAAKHGVACDELAKAVSGVDWAASTDDSRYILQSVAVESDAKKLTAVATNGRELGLVECALIGSKFSVLVPSAFAANFSDALLRDGAVFSSSENNLKVDHASGIYACKQLEGNYPNWRQVIPKEMKPLGEVNVAMLKELFSGCIGYDNKTEARGVFKFDKDGLTVEFSGSSDSKLTRHAEGKFKSFTIALSLRKILLVFSNLKTETAALHYFDELTPLRIDSGELSVLTMPMRLT